MPTVVDTFETNKALAEADHAHVLHPWATLTTDACDLPMIIEKAEGVYVTDSEGNRYLDAIGGMWCMTLGYGCKELAQAMQEQAMQMPYYTPFGNMSNAPAAQLAEKLATFTPGDLNVVHFTNSGSTAVDSAIRFCHFYFNALGQTSKKRILSRKDSYHGSTYLGATVSGKAWDKTHFNYADDLVYHLSSPHTYRRPEHIDEENFCDYLINELETTIQRLGADNIACYIAEPILASGGVIIPPKGYHQAVQALIKRNNILYISDEVVTGFARLGHFFASDHLFDLQPDIIITAKGLTSGYMPLGAAIISEKLIEDIKQSGCEKPVFTNGYTYSGHPIACSVALKNIELMEKQNLCNHVKEVGPYFVERLQSLKQYSIVGDVRGHHLMACIECRVNPTHSPIPTEDDIAVAQALDEYCQRLGLLVRPYESLCILSPPLIITKTQIDSLIDILHKSIKATMDHLGITHNASESLTT